ncbi:MAG: hypothetical protein ACE37K_04740 [Planctomycetota bacterium]
MKHLCPLRLAAMFALAFGSAADLLAQCADWRPEPADPGGRPGVSEAFAAAAWDPDGSGPASAKVVVGGAFGRAGSADASRLAVYDPLARSWQALTLDVNAPVYAVLPLPNGDLIVGGDFFVLDGVFATSIARWDGASWSPLGGGLDNRVQALAHLPNGDVVAGGYFATSGGAPMPRVARWNGSSWAPMGAGFNGTVEALTVDDQGNLFAVGGFTMSGSTATSRAARWDGAAWQPLGAGLSSDAYCALSMSNGDLVVGGGFQAAGGVQVSGLARWDGAGWHDLGGGVHLSVGVSRVEALAEDAFGRLIAGGSFDVAGSTAASRIARWNGNAWTALGSGVAREPFTYGPLVSSLCTLPSGDVFVAGQFARAGGLDVTDAAIWDGAQWLRTNDGVDGYLYTARQLRDGSLLVGGQFGTIGGLQSHGIARWNGASWSDVGGGLGGLSSSDGVWAFAERDNGDLIVAGRVSVVVNGSTQPGDPVWRWDGATWSPLNPAMQGSVRELLELPDGSILMGGTFTLPIGGILAEGVVRWDGTSWQAVGAGGVQSILDLELAPDGSVYAVGDFAGTTHTVARWDGAVWSPVGSGIANATEVAVLANGQPVVRDSSYTTRMWNGSSWVVISPPSTLATALTWLHASPDGDLIAGAQRSPGWPSPTTFDVLRWSGGVWQSMLPAGQTFGHEGLFAVATSYGLLLGGAPTQPDGQRPSLSRWQSLCPAGVQTFAPGCAGSQGVPGYTPLALPWLGASMRARASNLPANGLVVHVLGLGASAPVPLPPLLLPASTSCVLSVAPEAVDFAVASTTYETSLQIPGDQALLGIQVQDQVLAIETGAGGTIVQTTVTDALLWTVGTW